MAPTPRGLAGWRTAAATGARPTISSTLAFISGRTFIMIQKARVPIEWPM
jgi:hypothetical protein